LKLRSAIEDDLKDIYNLICDLEECNIDFHDFSQIYIDNITDKDIHYIVAEDMGRLIGFISLHIQKLLHHTGRISEIQELIVTDNYRGLGVGKVLFEEAKRISIEMECLQLEVCCNSKREKSHMFYLSQNMKQTHYKFTDDLKLHQ
jgi:PhnO protein